MHAKIEGQGEGSVKKTRDFICSGMSSLPATCQKEEPLGACSFAKGMAATTEKKDLAALKRVGDKGTIKKTNSGKYHSARRAPATRCSLACRTR